jgi:hypothetical protein
MPQFDSNKDFSWPIKNKRNISTIDIPKSIAPTGIYRGHKRNENIISYYGTEC